MFVRRWHYLTARLLVVVYTLAVTLAGLLHDHGDWGGADVPPQYGDVVAAGTADLAGATLLPADAHDDCDADCVVCRFLGQESLPVPLVGIVERHESVASYVMPATLELAPPLPRTLHSRAPPAQA